MSTKTIEIYSPLDKRDRYKRDRKRILKQNSETLAAISNVETQKTKHPNTNRTEPRQPYNEKRKPTKAKIKTHASHRDLNTDHTRSLEYEIKISSKLSLFYSFSYDPIGKIYLNVNYLDTRNDSNQSKTVNTSFLLGQFTVKPKIRLLSRSESEPIIENIKLNQDHFKEIKKGSLYTSKNSLKIRETSKTQNRGYRKDTKALTNPNYRDARKNTLSSRYSSNKILSRGSLHYVFVTEPIPKYLSSIASHLDLSKYECKKKPYLIHTSQSKTHRVYQVESESISLYPLFSQGLDTLDRDILDLIKLEDTNKNRSYLSPILVKLSEWLGNNSFKLEYRNIKKEWLGIAPKDQTRYDYKQHEKQCKKVVDLPDYYLEKYRLYKKVG